MGYSGEVSVRSRVLCVLLAAAFGGLTLGAAPQAREEASPLPPPLAPRTGFPDDTFHATVQKTCTKCHVEPPPDYLPRGMWRTRIQEMAQRSLTGTGIAPGDESTLWQMNLTEFNRYFEARSLEKLPPPEPWPAPAEGPLRFERHLLDPPEASPVPIVANVRFWDLDGDGRLEVVACDMGHGVVLHGDPLDKTGALREIAKIQTRTTRRWWTSTRMGDRTFWSPTSGISFPPIMRRAAWCGCVRPPPASSRDGC